MSQYMTTYVFGSETNLIQINKMNMPHLKQRSFKAMKILSNKKKEKIDKMKGKSTALFQRGIYKVVN